MIDVGMKDANPGAQALVDLTVPRGPSPAVMPRSTRPAVLPRLPEGYRLFAGYDQGFGEKLVLVESLEDAQYLWDQQDFMLVSPVWYSAPALFAQDN